MVQLTKALVADLVARYDHGQGDSVDALAEASELNPEVVKFQLKKAGVYVDPAEPDSDETLGIGEDEGVARADPLAELLKNPALNALIEAAVSKRVAELAPQTVAAAPQASGSEWNKFLAKFEHMLEMQAVQQPGYIKPLTADEMDYRLAGKVEMDALLKHYRERREWPSYILGDVFYGPSPNGHILYEAGQEIRTFLAPAEHFKPINEPAARIFAAMMQSIGDETPPIEELIARALIEARAQPQEVAEPQKAFDSDVQLVDAPRHDISARRITGGGIEHHGDPRAPRMPGGAAQPAGPVFVDQ